MRKQRGVRIWITIAALICMIAVCAMATWGTKNSFSDGLILAMELVGAAGIVLLLCNAVMAVWEFWKSRHS